MAFAIYLHREQWQPEEPQILERGLAAEGSKFGFVDFVPAVVKRPGTIITPNAEVEYHKFGEMVDTCNVWLARNPEWEAINCETVLLMYKYHSDGPKSYYELRPDDTSFYIYGTEKNNVLKALRVWMRRKDFYIHSRSEGTTHVAVSRTAQPNCSSNTSSPPPACSTPNLTTHHQHHHGRRNTATRLTPATHHRYNHYHYATQQGRAQTIRYLDIIPEPLDAEASAGKFETLDDLIARFNSRLAAGDHPQLASREGGQDSILSIECLNCEATNDWKIDPERSLASLAHKYVFIVRIFYTDFTTAPADPSSQHYVSDYTDPTAAAAAGSDQTEDAKLQTDQSNHQASEEAPQPQPVVGKCLQFGIMDFTPNRVSSGGFFKAPKYEPLSDVVSRGARWLASEDDHQQPADDDHHHLKSGRGVIFKNAQCLDIKMKSLSDMDTRQMSFKEHGDYIRIFRIAYTYFKDGGQTASPEPVATTSANTPTLPAGTPDTPPPPEDDPDQEEVPLFLSSKIFLPTKKSDTLNTLMASVADWLRQMMAKYEKSLEDDPTPRSGHVRPAILSAETVEIFAREFRDNETADLERAVDDTFQYNRFGHKNAYMIMAVRVYFDLGSYGRQAWEASLKGGPGRRPADGYAPHDEDDLDVEMSSPSPSGSDRKGNPTNSSACVIS